MDTLRLEKSRPGVRGGVKGGVWQCAKRGAIVRCSFQVESNCKHPKLGCRHHSCPGNKWPCSALPITQPLTWRDDLHAAVQEKT